MSEKKSRSDTFLPSYLRQAHDLCLMHHDILVELLRSAEESGFFKQEFKFRNDEDKRLFESSEHIFEWLDKTNRQQEYTSVLRWTTFPALLSDMLFFVHEALEASRKARLSVAYALIRKPIQETLFVLESMALDIDAFSDHLKRSPQRLRGQKAGGVDAHTRRIDRVLTLLGESKRFEASYLAQLRYDKSAEDGFDGTCNLAMHLFTDHDALRTEPLNINFVFSSWDEKITQWYFLYSRLPYLLCYGRLLFEHVFAALERTDPVYLEDIERRVAAATILWWRNVHSDYRSAPLERFAAETERDLRARCQRAGFSTPGLDDLVRMREVGAWPGEHPLRTRLREARYNFNALKRRAAAKLRQFAEESDPDSQSPGEERGDDEQG